MSVLETDIIDFAYVDERDMMPVLVVSDPLTWKPPEDESHLDALREKLNTQIAFVESGQIRSIWPGYAGGLIKVEVMARCALTHAARDFYAIAARTMQKANMTLDFHLCDG